MPDVDTFRIPFWRMYVPAAVYAQVMFAPLMWLQFYLMSGGRGFARMHVVLYCCGAAMVAVLLAPAFLVYVRAMKVKVTPDTLTCSNGFGKLVTVPWDSITAVRRLNMPGFPYLLVTATGTRLKLWLPLFLHRFGEFVDRVEECAGSNHMLYQAIWYHAE